MRTGPLAALALALLGAGLPRCTPGIRIEVFNHSAGEAAVTSVFNDGKSATRALAPGESLVLGPAVASLPPQPSGYPIGPAGRCGAP